MCGASEKPIMISGPAPEFDVTAVCWLMSSQPTKSTLTSTPVFCVNFAALARNTSSSVCTKRTGRSMRRLAPFSMLSAGAGTVAALACDASVCAEAPVAANAATESPRPNASRRVMSLIINSSLYPVRRYSPVPRPCLCLAVRAAFHADGLPASERGILQHRRIDAASRPHALQHLRQFIADAPLARLVEACRG